MKCKNKTFDGIYNYTYTKRNIVKIWNNKGFCVLIMKPMFERCFDKIEDDKN